MFQFDRQWGGGWVEVNHRFSFYISFWCLSKSQYHSLSADTSVLFSVYESAHEIIRYRNTSPIPGRMALLVTLFLVLVNIFNSVTGHAPKAEGLTAVETWVVSCIIHVFGVLAEYALILKIIQSEKQRDAKARRAFLKVLNNSNGISAPSKKTVIRRGIGSSNGSSTNMQVGLTHNFSLFGCSKLSYFRNCLKLSHLMVIKTARVTPRVSMR